MILTDLHIHSNFSDGKHAIPDLVDFYGKRGFGAIAITDHLCEQHSLLGKAASYLDRTLTPSTFRLYLEIIRSEQKRAWETYRMLVIPGFEVTKNSISNHRSAHLLGLGVSEWTPADLDVARIAEQIREQGALAVAAHPLSTQKLEKQTLHLWHRRDELREVLDAWEVGSGKHYFKEVEEARLPVLASTDLHHFGQFEGWKTLIDIEFNFHQSIQDNLERVLQSIREQKLVAHYHSLQHSLESSIKEDLHGVPFPGPQRTHRPFFSRFGGRRHAHSRPHPRSAA